MSAERRFRDFGDYGPGDGADGRLVGESPDGHEDYLGPDSFFEAACDADYEEADCEGYTACSFKSDGVSQKWECSGMVRTIESSAAATILLDKVPTNHIAEQHDERESHSDVKRTVITQTSEFECVCHVPRSSAFLLPLRLKTYPMIHAMPQID